LAAGSTFCFCSVGMILFNKFAIEVFPYECTLVAVQMLFAAAMLIIFTWKSLHIGSVRDLLRWCVVVPFFTGMLLTSILALKSASLSLVVTLRCLSPLVAILVESLYPNPVKIDMKTIISICIMLAGAIMYMSKLSHTSELAGVGWVFLNSAIAIIDRCMQRYLLSQNAVDISKTGVTLINNLLGSVPMILAAYATGELAKVHSAITNMSNLSVFYVALSCVFGLGISYTGVWAQSLISATSFLVMVNANKFVIIVFEAFFTHGKALTPTQLCGSCITITGACFYGHARQQIESDQVNKKLLEGPAQDSSSKKV